MADLEKVKRDLKLAIDQSAVSGSETVEIWWGDAMGALELLSEKEDTSVAPSWGNGYPYCGECGARIEKRRNYNYCCRCGRRVNWG